MNNIIQNIIHKFFNNSQPSTDDILFKKWLLSPKNREEKDQAISEDMGLLPKRDTRMHLHYPN